MPFNLHIPFPPAGDQPAAIQNLTEGILNGEKYQTLLGVTGSGKTYTIANVIQQLQRPTLVLTHNKTLVAQLYGEFRQFFPENAVEYFVSYYDYYQPEAYMPVSDVYIEKDLSINDELDKLSLKRISVVEKVLPEDSVMLNTMDFIESQKTKHSACTPLCYYTGRSISGLRLYRTLQVIKVTTNKENLYGIISSSGVERVIRQG